TGTSTATADDQFTYTAASAPTVTGLSLTSGSSAGGAVVTVTGTHLTAATAVSFGSVAADWFSVIDDNTLVASPPAHAAGTVHVPVPTDGGTSSTSSSDQFPYSAASAPTVTGLSLTSGSTAGGDAVVISGANLSGASAVSFGSLAAAFVPLDDNTILAFV